jgi:tetratricopeptide (TPR) repeat protein
MDEPGGAPVGKASRKRSTKIQTLGIASIVLLVGLAALDRVGRMDVRFFADSWPAARGFVHYLAADFGGAAYWYRVSIASSVDPRQTSSSGALLAGNHELAEALARRELTQHPEALAPALTLAEIALARAQNREALEQAGRVLKVQADDIDALLVTALAQARRRERAAALDTLKRALREDRLERRYTVFLAALQAAGDLAVLDDPPLCILAHIHRYLSAYDPARVDTAAQYAQRAIEAGDQADDALVTLATVHAARGQRRRALEEFEKAIAVNPSNTTALLGAARLRAARGELAAEYQLVQAAFQARPDDPFVAARLHDVLTRRLGDYRQALAMGETAVAARPDDPQAWSRLGAVQSRLGEHEAALRSFGRSVELKALAEAHEGMGDALRQLERYDEAAAAYERAVKIDAYRPGPFVGLALLHAREQRYPQALDAYEQARRLGADQVVELCALYHETGKLSRAMGCLQDVLARDPENPRGRTLMEQVQRTAASRRPA